MAKETAQERGRRGAKTAQRWLEATTFLELPLNSYKNERQCTVTCLDGTEKTFDLTGYFYDEDHTPVSVEVKNVTGDDHLREQFEEFLTVAYSSTAKHDEGRNFMWVSWHPFGPMSRWAHLTSMSEIQNAIKNNDSLLNGNSIDLDVLRKVSERTWVLTFNDRQEQLSLDADELAHVQALLKRKKSTL
ncbi:hypothetical protein [Kineococcus sp. SYSU DK003]|uniref:hypothetical protein n=1 Tax=Kineococcus sp. SYSU DK003 TaxID=3383124 RepID=UPI003D7CB6B9